MQGRILGLLAETHVHAGAGQSEQAIDLPVAREKTTDYPFVPGSGVKGALRDLAERTLRKGDPEIHRVYGARDGAGDLLISDARLLLLPVRCLARAYLWLTCPYLVERFRRDHERALGSTPPPVTMPDFRPAGDAPVVYGRGAANETLFLEERLFRRAGDLPEGLVDLVAPLVGDAGAKSRLAEQMALVSNEEFGWFARFALPVHAHNVLDGDKKEGEPRTKTSTNLWYEESLAPDTLLYVVTLYRDPATGQHLDGLFGTRPYLQVGGNETTGQGWFRIAMVEGGRP